MPKRSLNSNTVSYFNLKPSKTKSKSRSRSRSPNQRKSRSDESKGKNLTKSRTNPKRTKSVDAPKSKGNATKSNEVKKPVRTGNVPHNVAKKQKEEPLPKDLFDAKFRGKKVLIFKNSKDGHLVEEPLPLAVSEHSYPTFDSLLNHLNQKLTLRTGRVNKLYKIQGGEISEVKQLRDKGWYVASTGPYVPEGAIEKITKGKHKKDELEEEENGFKNGKKDNHLGSNLSRLAQPKYSVKKKTTLKSSSNHAQKELAESPRNPGKKPPVPKFKTREPSFNIEESEITESPRPKPILKPTLKTSNKPFGRMGTLKNHIRSQSLNSKRQGIVQGRRKSSIKQTEEFEEVESDMYEKPMARSMSSQSILRNKRDIIDEETYGYNEPEFRSNSRSLYGDTRRNSEGWKKNMTKDYASEEQSYGGRRQSDYPRQSSDYAKQSNDYPRESSDYLRQSNAYPRQASLQERELSEYQRTSSAQFQDRFDDPKRQYSGNQSRKLSPIETRYSLKPEVELEYEPSEMEPMNKVMYPSRYRPQSRKDAASSAKALQRDAAISAYKRDALTSAKNLEEVGDGRYNTEERYGYGRQEEDVDERLASLRNGRRSVSNRSYDAFDEENYQPYEEDYGGEYEEDVAPYQREANPISNRNRPLTKTLNQSVAPQRRDARQISNKNEHTKISQDTTVRRSRRDSTNDKYSDEPRQKANTKNSDKYNFSITVHHSND